MAEKKYTARHDTATPPRDSGWLRSAHILYIVIVVGVFLAMTLVLVFFPRTKYSELEKRELATFPHPETFRGKPAEYTAAISQWFSDSEPFRDSLMTLSMQLRAALRFTPADPAEAVTFRPAATPAASEAAALPGEAAPAADASATSDPDAAGAPDVNAAAKLDNSGIIIVGKGAEVRALMAFGGGNGQPLAAAVNDMAAELPSVHVYLMPVPIATEFYLPEKARKVSEPQGPAIDRIRQSLSANVRYVDAYHTLKQHTAENIYLRTDHHWTPLGAYYAARQLAHVAGVPFRDLQSYKPTTVHNFVGSMYGYSKDISVKNAPEDFTFYKPTATDYTTTSVIFTTDKDYRITGQTKETKTSFFKRYRDGSSGAYCSVIGGDQQVVKVVTGTDSRRRLLIIKDSYGNQVAPFMFYSFGEVHVIDFRYFPFSLRKYVSDHGITDIAVVFNIFNSCGKAAPKSLRAMLRSNTPFNPREASSAPAKSHKADSAAHSAPEKKKVTDAKKTPETPAAEVKGAADAPDAPETDASEIFD